jgi:isopentenyldiphosphate isomerase
MRNNAGIVVLTFILIFTSIFSLIWLFAEVAGINGSPQLLLIIGTISTVLVSVLLISSEERRNLIISILMNKRSIDDYNMDIKDNYTDEILSEIDKAKREIFVLGSLSSTFLTPQRLQVFAKALQNNPQLRLYIYFDSVDNLNRRNLYLSRPIDVADRRSLHALEQKHGNYELIRKEITDYVATDYQPSVSSRIIAREVHLQMYATIMKIDNLIYWSPISHRRGSRNLCFRLRDIADPFYIFAKEYIDYMLLDECGEPFCVEPKSELIPVFTDDGNYYGNLPRITLKAIPLLRHVVHGFIFDLDGRILIQKRGNLAMDNQGLWDKSFGGHVATTDESYVETLRREMREELMGNSKLAPSLVYVGDMPTNALMKVIIKSGSADQLVFFHMRRINQYDSLRQLPDGKTETQRQKVDIFCAICSDKVAIVPQNDVAQDVRWVPVDELHRNVVENTNDYTDDLIRLFTPNSIYANEFNRIAKTIQEISSTD